MKVVLVSSTATLLFSCSIIIFSVMLAWKFFNWVWLTPKKFEKQFKDQGFLGNPYRLLIGDAIEISKLMKDAGSKPIDLSDDPIPRVFPQFHNFVNKYGKVTWLWLGPKPNVIIMEPELIREVTQNMSVFRKAHSLTPVSRYITQGFSSYDGDKWAKHRKLINPAFHLEKLKLMLPSFCISASEMLSKWEEIITPKGSCELDVFPHLQTLSFDAISRTAFGRNYEEGRKIFELQREQSELFFKAVQKLFIPWYRFLPTKENRRMEQILKEVDDSIKEIINKRFETRKTNHHHHHGFGDDLLGLLLESNSQEIDFHGKEGVGMSIEEIIDECKLFYVAGKETNSALLVWTMVLLSRHTDWQARAREEVFQLFGSKKPDFDGLNRLKCVTMILYEVLRLYPPTPILRRKTAQETKLGNLSLPAEALISLPIMLIHHDPEIWGEDASEFKPERFGQGISNATKGQVVFLPFGRGPRTCIGQNFSMLEAKLVMAMILQRFSFELSPSYSHAPHLNVALQPQNGAHLLLHKL